MSELPGAATPSVVDPVLAISAAEIERVARFYRRLVILVGLQLLAYFVIRSLPSLRNGSAELIVMLVILVGSVCVLGLALSTTRGLAKALHLASPTLYGIGAAIPCVSIFVLAQLNWRAQAWCAARGIEVGFFGPTKASLERLRSPK